MHRICNDLIRVLTNMSNENRHKVLGLLVDMTQRLTTGTTSDIDKFLAGLSDDLFQRHQARFAHSHSSQRMLFANALSDERDSDEYSKNRERTVLQEMQPQLPKPSGGGRMTTKRLKSRVEVARTSCAKKRKTARSNPQTNAGSIDRDIVLGGRRKPSCSLCFATGHQVNTPCPVITSLHARRLNTEEVDVLSEKLGCPSAHGIRDCPRSIEVLLEQGNRQEAELWPPEAKHLFLIDAFHPPERVMTKTRFGGGRQRTILTGSTLIQVEFLGLGGGKVQHPTGKNVIVPASVVRKWIDKKISPNTGKLLSRLTPSKPSEQVILVAE